MEVLGYADRFSVLAGERIEFMVSCERERFGVEIVRLDRAYTPHDPAAWNPPVVPSPASGEYPGRVQPIHAGSYVRVDATDLSFAKGASVHLWLHTSLPARGREQGLVGRWSDESASGFLLGLDAEGRLFWRCGAGEAVTVTAPDPVLPKRWVEVAATIDAGGAMRLRWCELPRGWVSGAPAGEAMGSGALADPGVPLLIGAAAADGDGVVRGHFNGKIDRPALWPRALADEELELLRAGTPASGIAGVVADWDPTADYRSRRLVDLLPSGRHGTLVNLPARFVPGANWTRRDVSPHRHPGEFGAIHYHEDDLEDCGWGVDFGFDVPADLPSGVYAARLTAGETVDHVPFYVRPRPGKEAAVLYLAPTNTYLAYGNEKLFRAIETDPEMVRKMTSYGATPSAADEYLRARPELGASTYDLHEDGSGTFYSSRLRPLITMRPTFLNWMTGELRHFSGDQYLVEWLEGQGIAYDVATDEDVHMEGVDAFAPYKVVITGGHPEYWSAEMMEAIETYLAHGGRLMYLGGNGFYWVTGQDRDYPHVVELRRGFAGTAAWHSAPGETYLTTSGDPGGIWRLRGRNPNRLTGIGFAAQGWGGAEGYVRTEAAADPSAAWVFDGIAPDEVIGAFGHVMDGAAGDEIDRYDLERDTPPETLRLATTEGRQSDYYQLVIEDCQFMLSGMGGQNEPRVRSDITLLEMPNGGAVFAAGSIVWNASLTWNGGDNNVSRVTANVLRRFSAD